MSSQPTVTIVIPVLNGRSTIAQTIESALNQTYANREIIVVDNGSTDGTSEILTRYHRRVQVHHEPIRGANRARNRGLRHARGDYLQFLDADDLLHPDKLAVQVPLAVSRLGSMIICDGEVIERNGDRHAIVHSPEGEDPFCYAALYWLTMLGPLFNTDEVRSVGGFDESLMGGHDFELPLRLALRGATLIHTDICLFTVRKQIGSVSSNEIKGAQWRLRLMTKIAAQISNSDPRACRLRQALARRNAADGRLCLAHGADLATAQAFFDAAADLHPSAGLEWVYGPLGRLVHRTLGPMTAHRLSVLKAKFRRRIEP